MLIYCKYVFKLIIIVLNLFMVVLDVFMMYMYIRGYYRNDRMNGFKFVYV